MYVCFIVKHIAEMGDIGEFLVKHIAEIENIHVFSISAY